jgi:hypothetical protein
MMATPQFPSSAASQSTNTSSETGPLAEQLLAQLATIAQMTHVQDLRAAAQDVQDMVIASKVGSFVLANSDTPIAS